MSSCPSPEPVPGSTGQGRQHASSTPRGPREGRASCSATRIKPSLGGGAWPLSTVCQRHAPPSSRQSLVGCHLWGRTESDTTETT